MNAKLLIDAIVQQTTVLIAQLSTAAGVRAPLAHVADQVFLELSREIEAQGVSRKVAADMFGLAIRTYQKKVLRLTQTVAEKENTLWQAALEHLQTEGSAPRTSLIEHFQREDPAVVGSILNDLVSSGLVYKTGSGEATIFGVTSQRDLAQAADKQQRDALAPLLCAFIYRSPGISRKGLRSAFGLEDAALDAVLQALEDQGNIERVGDGDTANYRASTLVVPVAAEHGWEAAVFDHFQAVVRAIGRKVERGVARSAADDSVGGATLTFDITTDHPHHDEVTGLLRTVRAQINELWQRVEDYNEQHPVSQDTVTQVSFYFGQCLTPPDED